MPDEFTKADAVSLLGFSAKALEATPNADAGEIGEVVRADEDPRGYTICVEWGGHSEVPPRFDIFSKPETQSSLRLERRSPCH